MKSYVADHPGVTRMRKLNSLILEDPARFERRLREFATSSHLDLTHIQMKPATRKPAERFFEPMTVTLTTAGAFADHLAFWERLARLAIVQVPGHLTVVRRGERTAVTFGFKVYRVADPTFYAYSGNERAEDEKVARLHRESGILAATAENGAILLLWGDLLAARPTPQAAPVVVKALHWRRGRLSTLTVAGFSPGAAGAWENAAKATGDFKSFAVNPGKKSAAIEFVFLPQKARLTSILDARKRQG